MSRFKDKVVIVTGGNKGIGAAASKAFAREGAKVVGVARSSHEECQKELGGSYEAIQADLGAASQAQLREMVAGVVQKHGRIDVLVNNAGIIRRAPATEYSEQDWDDVLRINLRAPFFLTQAVAKWWIEAGSKQIAEPARLKIVNIASLLSFQGGITVPAYTASKHGIAGITKALANEWAAQRINVNAIAPGYIATDNTQALRDNPVRNKAILERIPQGYWGDPKDIAGSIAYLASADADYVNGAVLNVDGGWLGR
jgi:2-deoxy-D-gluconate 3-dehydrogenase